MSVTTRDIFGAAPAIEPATPGSYGEAPAGFRLPAATAPGAVTLQVGDLERSLDFYRATLGLADTCWMKLRRPGLDDRQAELPGWATLAPCCSSAPLR